MDDDNNELNKSISANNNSVVAKDIKADNNSGTIIIGNNTTNNYARTEEDTPLKVAEIQNGLRLFAEFLPERALVLQEEFDEISRNLSNTLVAEIDSLSKDLKKQREDNLDMMKEMCLEILEVSFHALCRNKTTLQHEKQISPFKGLNAFRPEDKGFYFGRDKLIQDLENKLKKPNFLAVVGDSGSGKSSLVMAGVIPRLFSDGKVKMAYFTPSTDPSSRLKAAQEGNKDEDTVFVVDQFEELFTLTKDEREHEKFISELIELSKTKRVVITLRGDFLTKAIALDKLIDNNKTIIKSMTTEEMVSAMEKQAEAGGLSLEKELSEQIIKDIENEPGAMPLLQHALLILWERRHGRHLKLEEYQNFGGVKQAIANTADNVYTRRKDEDGKDIDRPEIEKEHIKHIFLRLTQLDESGQGLDTRRRVLIHDLTPINSDSAITINILDELANAHLLVKTTTEGEVAHEALIRKWDKLAQWLQADKEILKLRDDVSEEARKWDNQKQDKKYLTFYINPDLDRALGMPKFYLNKIEQDYLDACKDLRAQKKSAEERRRKITFSISIAAAIALAVLGLWGLGNAKLANDNLNQAYQNATAANNNLVTATIAQGQAQNQAATAQAASTQAFNNLQIAETEKANAEESALIASAGNLAGLALAEKDRDFSLALLLGVEAYRAQPNTQTESALLTLADSHPGVKRFLFGHQSSVNAISFGPEDSNLLASISDDELILWNVSDPTNAYKLATLESSGGSQITFSTDGSAIRAGDESWDISTPTTPIRLSNPENILWMLSDQNLSPDGNVKAYPSDDRYKIELWDISNPDDELNPISSIEPDSDYVESIVFTPDGNLVVGFYNSSIQLWDLQRDINKPTKVFSFIGQTQPVLSVTVSPDGKYVAAGADDGSIVILQIATPASILQKAILPDHQEKVTSVAFNSSGNVVASAENGLIKLWQMNDDNTISQTPLTDIGTYAYDDSLIFSPIEDLLTNTESIWDIHSPAKPIEKFNSLSGKPCFIADGKFLMAGSSLWNFGDPSKPKDIFDFGDYFSAAACSLERNLIATTTETTIQLWDASNPEQPEIIGGPLQGHTDRIDSIAFSPDGNLLASGGRDKIIILWNISDPEQPQYIRSLKGDGFGILNIVFRPDGKWLASAGWKPTISLWEITNPVNAYQIGALTGQKKATYSLAFSPDGKNLVSGNHEGNVILWDLDPVSLKEKSCQVAGRNFTRNEWTQYFPNEKYRKTCEQWPLEPELTLTPTATP